MGKPSSSTASRAIDAVVSHCDAIRLKSRVDDGATQEATYLLPLLNLLIVLLITRFVVIHKLISEAVLRKVLDFERERSIGRPIAEFDAITGLDLVLNKKDNQG